MSIDENKLHLIAVRKQFDAKLDELIEFASKIGLGENDVGEALLGNGIAMIHSAGNDPSTAIKCSLLAISQSEATSH